MPSENEETTGWILRGDKKFRRMVHIVFLAAFLVPLVIVFSIFFVITGQVDTAFIIGSLVAGAIVSLLAFCGMFYAELRDPPPAYIGLGPILAAISSLVLAVVLIWRAHDMYQHIPH